MIKSDILKKINEMEPGISAVGYLASRETSLQWAAATFGLSISSFFSSQEDDVTKAINLIATDLDMPERQVSDIIANAHRDDVKDRLATAIYQQEGITEAFRDLRGVTVEVDVNYLMIHTFVMKVLELDELEMMSEDEVKEHCLALRSNSRSGIQGLLKDLHKRGVDHGGVSYLSELAVDYKSVIEYVAPMASYAGENYGALAKIGSKVFSRFADFNEESRDAVSQFFYTILTETETSVIGKELLTLLRELSNQDQIVVDDIVTILREEKDSISMCSGLVVSDVEDVATIVERMGNTVSLDVVENIIKGISKLEESDGLVKHAQEKTLTMDHLDKVAEVLSVLDEQSISSDVVAQILDMNVMQNIEVDITEGITVHPVAILKSIIQRFSINANLEEGIKSFREGMFDYGRSLSGLDVLSINGENVEHLPTAQINDQLRYGSEVVVSIDGQEKTLRRKPIPALKTILTLLNDSNNHDVKTKSNNVKKALILLVKVAQPSTFAEVMQFLPESKDLLVNFEKLLGGMDDRKKAEKVINSIFKTYEEHNYEMKVSQAYVPNLLVRTMYSTKMRPYYAAVGLTFGGTITSGILFPPLFPFAMLFMGLVIAATVAMFSYNVAMRPTEDVSVVTDYIDFNQDVTHVMQQVSKLAVGIYTNDANDDPDLVKVIEFVKGQDRSLTEDHTEDHDDSLTRGA